uniref:Uncharacterized protein n=1 Tax=Cacopsylla melanoneura TaxID=428564 RepID=A0A8D9FJJ6_9HEMI
MRKREIYALKTRKHSANTLSDKVIVTQRQVIVLSLMSQFHHNYLIIINIKAVGLGITSMGNYLSAPKPGIELLSEDYINISQVFIIILKVTVLKLANTFDILSPQ